MTSRTGMDSRVIFYHNASLICNICVQLLSSSYLIDMKTWKVFNPEFKSVILQVGKRNGILRFFGAIFRLLSSALITGKE